MKSTKFNIGDIVKIRPDSTFYGAHKDNNPSEKPGKIIGLYESMLYRVVWLHSGDHNSYSEIDLTLYNGEFYEIY